MWFVGLNSYVGLKHVYFENEGLDVPNVSGLPSKTGHD